MKHLEEFIVSKKLDPKKMGQWLTTLNIYKTVDPPLPKWTCLGIRRDECDMR